MPRAEDFRLSTSNRLEHLLEAWVGRLAAEPLPPFAREVVVVQSQGMRRWLTLELAQRRGIAAGLWMPFPRDLARCLTDAALDGRLAYEGGRQRAGEPPEPFDREILLWRLYALLGRPEGGPGGALRVPAAYLAGDHDGRKRFQLAARLAALFDDYQLFRGDWLRDFAAGRPLFDEGDPRREMAAWQGWLWRQLLAESSGEPLSSRLERAIGRLRAGPSPSPLPARITVFGVASLPPVLLELLRAASLHLPVEIYFASPTWHYWGDLFSDREQSRLARRFRRRDAAPPAGLQHLERGNSLLSALGAQGRDFFNLLQELDEDGESWHEVDFEEPGQGSALRAVQSDILNLVDRGGPDAPPLPLLAGDLSLRVHVCHSPLREMEVLREELLHAFLEMPGLRPSDVLVLLPEIESYAPLIDAVFGVAHQGAPELPYSVADRRLASTQKPAAALLGLLDLVGSRLTVAEVFSLLESPALRRAAAIEESELALLRARVQAVGIRWGIDGRRRSDEFAIPLFEEASWQAGIDRLLFGYAVGPSEALSCGVAPAAGDGVGDTDLLGRFLQFLDRLFADLGALAVSRPAAEWSRDLIALVGRQLAAGDEDEELALQLLRDAFARLEEASAAEMLGEKLPLEVIRQFLRRLLADDQKSGGFLSGGITFCALRPMRSIPFRLVAVAGLDDASFPRRDPPRAFDLLAAAPRPGDRSPRLDDRYLFLETLLAARERLLLFYPGASQRDAAERAPSVVVAELLDLLDRTFAPDEGGQAREKLVVRHPLQAWSAANFAAARPSSSRENAAAGRALAAPRQEMPPFLGDGFAAIPANQAEGGKSAAGDLLEATRLELGLDELIEAFTSPSRYFCRRVLQLALARDEEEEPLTEPFDLSPLPRFQLLQEMLERRLDGGEPSGEHELELLRARFDLPPALLGEAAYRRLRLEVATLLGRLPPGLRRPATGLPIEIAGSGWLLRGAVPRRGSTLLRVRPGQVRPRDLLSAFIEGLAVEAATPSLAGEPARTVVFGREGGCELRPAGRPGRALEQLGELVAGFRELRRRPLPFFENASFAFAEERLRQRDPRQARRAGAELEAARRAFAGHFAAFAGQGRRASPAGRPGGDRDAAVRLLWRGRDPLAESDFADWAGRVFLPVLEARRELKA